MTDVPYCNRLQKYVITDTVNDLRVDFYVAFLEGVSTVGTNLKMNFDSHQITSYHSIIDYFIITAHPAASDS